MRNKIVAAKQYVVDHKKSIVFWSGISAVTFAVGYHTGYVGAAERNDEFVTEPEA